jgi:hypothetical protein
MKARGVDPEVFRQVWAFRFSFLSLPRRARSAMDRFFPLITIYLRCIVEFFVRKK